MSTWGELRSEIEGEYDLMEETFINSSELMVYANDAIEDAEAEIRTVNPDYFQSEAPLELLAGEAVYDMPTDIYGSAIKLLMFDDGQKKYEIKPIRNLSVISDMCEGDDFRYRITNIASEGTKLRIYPTPAKNDSTSITLYYIRNAKRISEDTDEVDLPEAKGFIKQFVVDKAVNKENMQPGAPESPALARKRQLFIDAIKVMTPDNNNEPLVGEDPYCEQIGY